MYLTSRSIKRRLETANPTPGDMGGVFRVKGVYFDDERGIGNTPMGQEIQYRGAVAWIRPSVFRQLALRGSRHETVNKLLPLVEAGHAIASPFLILDSEDYIKPVSIRVKSHEGRARADLFRIINGEIPMPVQLHFVNKRARNLSMELFQWIEDNGLLAEDGVHVIRPNSSYYFWMHQTVVIK